MIIELLSGLSSVISPAQFVVVLLIIALVSFGVIMYFIRNVRKKTGLWSFLSKPDDEEVKIADVLLTINALAQDSEKYHKEALDVHKEILINVLATRDEHRDKAGIVLGYLEQIKTLESALNDAKLELTRHIDELRRQFTVHDLHDQQLYESLKATLASSLQVISRINAQVEKIDEYARTAVPEFKLAHKELSRDIGNLSRDIALVERSIQSQINNVNAVKLK